MRILGVDVGRRRIGLAVSDETGLLARPWQTVGAGHTPADSVTAIAHALLADPSMEVGHIVVGLPRRLNGDDNDETPRARLIADGLAVLDDHEAARDAYLRFLSLGNDDLDQVNRAADGYARVTHNRDEHLLWDDCPR